MTDLIHRLEREHLTHQTVYNDDRRRKALFLEAAEAVRTLSTAIDEAREIIDAVGTTGIHHKVKDAICWLNRYDTEG